MPRSISNPLFHRALAVAALLAWLRPGLHAQPYTPEERLQGYRDADGRAVFIFDEAVYAVRPRSVMLEGTMRDWDHDMRDPRWALNRSSEAGVWTLVVDNPGRHAVPIGAKFKFRTDEGTWMDPPKNAPNAEAGNLVFAHDRAPLVLKAEIRGSRDVRLVVQSGEHILSTDPASYRLKDAAGNTKRIGSVEPVGTGEVRIVPVTPVDSTRVYFLEIPALDTTLFCSFDGWMRGLHSRKELGANVDSTDGRTCFRILAPRAIGARLYLYHQRAGGESHRIIDMVKDRDGVWESCLPGDLHGTWYDFTVHGPADPGNEFFEQRPVHISDPYARVSDDSFGRSRVWRKTRPATPLRNGIPRMEDVVAYEVHVEDFTRALPGLEDRKRGTFTGFFEAGLRNARGAPVGIDHLVNLGINVIHLLPVQEYLHYPDDEWQRAFLDDPVMRALGIAEHNYAWGYRTSHAFALESRYREHGAEHGAQNDQFRDLVQACHDRGIAVIVDVVFNHTAERMDAREMYFHFRVLDRHLYYRTNANLDFIGDYGTETKSEDRPMVARWIRDQCQALIDEYGVDGFRIDLAGLTDKRTLRELIVSIGEDKIVYGEPWIASADPGYEANPEWNWYKADAPITFFQDDTRNALCGPPDNPHDKRSDRGYAGGNGRREPAKRAVANSFTEEAHPNAGINYLDIHDNWALADRFATSDWNGEHGVDEGPYRIAAAMLLTSLGPVVIHGGSEFMRSKGSAPLVELVKRTESGPIWIHGKRDTYNLRKANLFQWENLGWNRIDGAACDYQRMSDYWKGLIALRNSAHGKVFRIGVRPPVNYIQWIEPADSMQLGYVVGATVCTLVNTAEHAAMIQGVMLPDGRWLLVADGDVAGTEILEGRPDSILPGGSPVAVEMPPTSVKIWIRE